MKQKPEYFIVNNELPSFLQDNIVLDIKTNNVTAYTHGFHKYPGKFIPQIPRWAINKYLINKKNKCILDPFCGSGTTLVEGVLSNHNVIGFDIDPLSVLISRVKTTPVESEQFIKIYNWILNQLKKNIKGQFIPECQNIEHWFLPNTIKILSKIRTIIDNIETEFGNNKDIQDLFYICFSSILRRVSNADNESQKTYVSHTNIKTPEEPLILFTKQLEYFKSRILDFSNSLTSFKKSDVICIDAAKSINGYLNNCEVDLVITSPPYIKAIDYIYNQMVELFWIGDLFSLQTQEKQNKLKKLYIGSKSYHIIDYKDYSPLEYKTDIKELDDNLKLIFLNDKKNGHKHSYITYKYFFDMENHFRNLSKNLNKNVHYIMVIGNSKVSDVNIDTAGILSKMAERNNFTLTNKFGYKIKNRYMRFDRKGRGGIINHDWVLDFNKN